jgi:hypothetical protein
MTAHQMTTHQMITHQMKTDEVPMDMSITIVSDAPNCGVTYDHISFIIQATGHGEMLKIVAKKFIANEG